MREGSNSTGAGSGCEIIVKQPKTIARNQLKSNFFPSLPRNRHLQIVVCTSLIRELSQRNWRININKLECAWRGRENKSRFRNSQIIIIFFPGNRSSMTSQLSIILVSPCAYQHLRFSINHKHQQVRTTPFTFTHNKTSECSH